MVRVLAVSDEVDEGLYSSLDPVRGAELILACGDLPFDYLRHLVDGLEVPAVFVPGNHDPDVSGYRLSRGGLMLRAGLPVDAPWPRGAVNADRRVVTVAGLRIAGLGGSPRYSGGPNQYSRGQFRRRSALLRWRAFWRARHGLDVLLTHAPPQGVGDGPDPPHHGVAAVNGVVAALHPALLLHGHVHPYGAAVVDRTLGATVVRNVVGRHLFDIEPTREYRESRA